MDYYPARWERPQDDYKATHNLRLFKRDEIFGGQVSRLQVAELVAWLIVDPRVALGGANKVIEVVAEVEAPKKSFTELLTAVDQSSS